jgi:hypothetical protein
LIGRQSISGTYRVGRGERYLMIPN